MTNRLFNQAGVLTKEGAGFVNDTFGKELHKVLKTAADKHEARIIGSILQSMVGNQVSLMFPPPPEPIDDLSQATHLLTD